MNPLIFSLHTNFSFLTAFKLSFKNKVMRITNKKLFIHDKPAAIIMT